MAFVLFMLTNAALFIRPAELFPALGNVQVFMPLIVSTVLCNLRGIHAQLRTRTLIQQPANLCVLGVVLAVPLSHLTGSMNLSAAYHGFIAMGKVGIFYFALTSVINTPERLRKLMLTTSLCATVVVGASVLDFQAFCARWSNTDDVLEQMEKDRLVDSHERVLFHAVETHGFDERGDITFRYRMRGLGIFSDPNDVALLIAVSGCMCLYFLTDRGQEGVRWLWLIPLAILGYGYIQTQSRGGLLAIAVAGMLWMAVRYGRSVAITLGVLGLLAAPLALGRAGDIDISQGSGQERVQLWSEGLHALRSSKFFFGIGEGQMVELANLVAHNSYIHSFVETGFLGGTAFFGCFFFLGLALYRIRLNLDALQNPELRRMLPFIAAIFGAWCMGMVSLSLCYALSTFMVVGLVAAYVNLAGYYRTRPQPVIEFNWPLAQRFAFCSFGLLLASYGFVKIFARFGA